MMGQPWWKIWGWDPTTCPNTSFTVGLDTEEVVREKTREASPYKVIKVKLGRTEAEDKMMINTIRSVTDTVICIDANQGWKDKYYALDMIHWLAERNVNMIEQPMSKYALDQTAWLTERSPLPIIADEACQRLVDVKKLHGAYHGINIKLMKCTGLREAREMVSLAQTLDMKLMIGCMTETSCAITTGAQIAPKTEWADLDGNLLISNDCYKGMTIVDGKITLHDKPGLGLEPVGKPVL
jgi:L-alanine-DL-glutamate epimerase-like enolase superfamily enzyme